MSVAADAENLQIDAAGALNVVFIGGAVFFVVAGDGAVGNMNVAGIDIHMGKEVLQHEMVKAVGMLGRNSEIFIEIEGERAGEIEAFLTMQAGEFAIDAESGASGGQSEADRGILAHG